jgi:hypothetical protein
LNRKKTKQYNDKFDETQQDQTELEEDLDIEEIQ